MTVEVSANGYVIETIEIGERISLVPGPQGPPGAAGAAGDPGPAGPQGVQGLQGPPGAIGPAGLTWRGAWDAATDYVVNDAVGYQGASWFASADPAVGEVPSETALNWQLLAAQGAQGPQGVQGPQGEVGPQGLAGPEGPAGPQGLDGAPGPAGPQGEVGPQGPAGPQGLEGPAGPQGEVGPQGPAGQDAAASTWQSNADSTAIIPVDNSDSWIVGSDRMDRDAADLAKDYRAFFSKAKGAFRAGSAGGAQWDDASVGFFSAAFGENTTASGVRSFAEGNTTTASGFAAHAEGSSSQATADYTHAEGVSTKATGTACHAEGQQTQASAQYSHAEGSQTIASGSYAHSEGASTTASGNSAHAEGEGTVASGLGSHAQGRYNTASATAAHVEGSDSEASGAFSHAEGSWALASRYAQRAKASGSFMVKGDAQAIQMVLRRTSTDATAGVLTANAGSALLTGVSTNVLTIPARRTHKFRVEVAARRTDVAGEASGWSFEGVIARDATGDARLVGATTSSKWNDAAAAAWDVTLSINTVDATNNYLAITATGEAGKTIRWVAEVNTVEVG